MKINLSLQNKKLKVTSMNEQHENHQLNPQTFRHYPENVRLSSEEESIISTMLQTDANKQKVKDYLEQIRLKSGNNAPVPLKSIHNAQTKNRKQMEKLHAGENELQRLLDGMLKVPGSRIRVLKDENNELLCIYFQDSRMVDVFDKYPELLLFDATYKMNNREMPLFVQSAVDGNGATEIVCIGICRSESKAVVGFILDTFKSLNPNWEKVKCVVGDKDFADRIVYTEKFNNISLQICLFHVLRTFNREITTVKRNITKEQRDDALKILQLLCYARSKYSYDENYEKLSELNLPGVMDYFNQNWHNIREEWSLYGRNEYANFLNNTNNRSESMNHKLKMIGTRHANLLTFFENVSTSIRVLASEKDLKAVRQDMRTIRVRFDDFTLKNYNELLTSFIFTKLQEEYKNRDLVELVFFDSEAGMTNYGRTVTSSTCSCTFHKSMILPCRHIFKFREQNEIELFAPELCDPRWTKQYYRKSHPALTMNDEIPTTAPIYVQRVQTPAEKDKYRASAAVTKDINSILTSMSTSEFTFVMGKLKKFRDNLYIGGEDENLENGNDDLAQDEAMVLTDTGNLREKGERPLDLSVPNSSTISNLSESTVFNSNGQAQMDEILSTNGASNGDEPSYEQTIHDRSNGSQFVVIASTSSQQVQNLNFPTKRRATGRPKGTVNNVIGLKRRNVSQVQNNKKIKVTPMIQSSSEKKSVQSDRVLRRRKM